jgi:hypothetical protein
MRESQRVAGSFLLAWRDFIVRDSAASYSSEDDEGFAAVDDGGWEEVVGGLVGEVFFAGEEADEGATVLGGVVSDGASEGGEGCFEGVENGAEGDWGFDLEWDFVRGDGGVAE